MTARDRRLGGLVRGAVGVGLGRGALTAASVAASALLSLVLMGVERSVTHGITAWSEQPTVDAWVLPRGQDNLVRLAGTLTHEQVAAARAVPGVAVAQPVLRTFLVARPVDAPDGDPGATMLALALPDPGGPGGAPGWVDGRAPETPGEIGLDRALAWKLGVGVGGRVRVGDRPLTVVGLSRDTDLIATRFAFLDMTVAQQLSSYHGQASFIALQLAPDAGADTLARVAQAADADVVDHATFTAGNLRELLGGFRAIEQAVAAIGVVASSFVVALVVQGLLEQRRRDVAVLAALGLPLRTVALALVGEVARIVGLGVALGGAVAAGLAAVTDRLWPVLALSTSVGDAAAVGALFVGVGCLAALAPLARLRSVDPAETFRP